MLFMWIFMLLINLSIPLSMLLLGIKYCKKPPQEINGFSGYRTVMSMKNNETWSFSQRYIGYMWKKAGLVLTIVTPILMLIPFNSNVDVIGWFGLAVCAVQMVVLFVSMFLVEKALKKRI